MKKAYVLFPFLGLIIFIGIWWNYHSEYQERAQQKVEQARAEFEARRLQEARDREIAIKDALAAQEVRRKERAEKEAKDQADKEARQLAEENERKSAREKQKFSAQVDRLSKEIETEKSAIAALEEQKRKATVDLGMVKEYVRLAQTNERNLLGILDRIAAADAARAAAEAAAAAAKK
jgi:hypothetical protein